MSDISETLDDYLETIADARDIPKGMVRNMFERRLGIDLADVSDADAEEFIEAVENDEFETVRDVLGEYGVDDETIDGLIEEFEAAAEAEANAEEADTGNSGSAASGGGSSGLSEAEIDAKIQQAVPSAGEIASEIKRDLGGGGGGQGAQSQEEQGNQMGQILSLVQLMNDGGASGGLGQEFQEMAMKSFIADMRKPDLGDLLEKQYYEEVLGSDAVEDIYGDYMPDAPDEDDEDDDIFAEFS